LVDVVAGGLIRKCRLTGGPRKSLFKHVAATWVHATRSTSLFLSIFTRSDGDI
jgi:hypothetical protein